MVAFGDSITDGAAATPESNGSYPSALARRLLKTSRLAVVNGGISGNRVLHDGMGVSALARFDADVLARPGVRSVIVLEGINDIGFPAIPPGAFGPQNPFSAEAVAADDIIAGLQQMIERAHARGIRMFGATLTPFEGAAYANAAGESKRAAVNQWIRTSKAFDGVVDFDAMVRDPKNSLRILPGYDSGDHLHPSNAGYQAMADGIDLGMLAGGPPARRGQKEIRSALRNHPPHQP